MASMSTQVKQDYSILESAIRYLAGVCDGAVQQDGHGFDASDTRFGHYMATVQADEWTDFQAYAVYEMARKYRHQLERIGINFDDIPAVAEPDGVTLDRTLTVHASGGLFLRFEYDEQLVRSLSQGCPRDRREFVKVPDKGWIIDLDPGLFDSLLNWCVGNQVTVSDKAQQAMAQAKIQSIQSAPNLGAPKAHTDRTIELADSPYSYAIAFDYNPAFVTAVKAIPEAKRKFDGDHKPKRWLLKPAIGATAQLLKFGQDNGFTFGAGAEAKIQADIESENKALVAQITNLEGSRAVESDFEVPEINGQLKPYQKAGVQYAVQNERCIIGDGMGLGKSLAGISYISSLKAYPAVIACPGNLKVNWQRELKKWLPSRTVCTISGVSASSLPSADIYLVNYEVLAKSVMEYRDGKKVKVMALTETGKVIDSIKGQAIVCDEFHRCKAKSLQSQAIEQIAQSYKYRLGMTGTPIKNRPDEWIRPLQIIGRLDDMGGWFKFAKRYCKAEKTRYGWDTSGAANLEELNTELRRLGIYVRRTKQDVMKELPPRQVTVVPIELTNRLEYVATEQDVLRWVGNNAESNREFLQSIQHLSPEAQRLARSEHRMSAMQKAEQAEHLVKINACKTVASKGKQAGVIEWIKTFLESDEKLVIFAERIEMQDALIAAFPDACRVVAKDSRAVQDAFVQKFQNDPSAQLMICSLKIGSEGFTMTAASHVAFCEFPWTPAEMDQGESRVYGRINDPHGVSVWHLVAENTIDEDIIALLEEKRAVVDAATDGIVTEDAGGMIAALMAGIEMRRAA